MAAAVLAEEALTHVLVPDPDAENHPLAPNGSGGPPRGKPPTEEAPNCPRGKDFMGPQSHADVGADDRTDSITGPVRPIRPGAEGRGPFASSSPVSPPHPPHAGAPIGAPWGLFNSPAAGSGASAAFMLLREAPQAVRDIWKASFESKRLRRRHFLLQVDLAVVCSWISVRLEAALLPPNEGALDAAAFATATAVYGQLVPQVLWATAVVASGLTTLTLQGTRALWARLQLLALDATSSTSAAAAAGVAGTSSVGGKRLRRNDHAAALYGTSRIFGRRKRRKPQQQQQQQRQQQDEGTVAVEAAAGLSGGSAEPELLLQQIPRLRGNASQASALLSSFLSVAGREQEGSPSLHPSPFAALRQDLLQLGALRPPGGSRLLLGGGPTASSSTSSIAASVASDTASAAAAAAAPSNCSTNDMGAMGADRWALMSWQSVAAAAAAALQHGLSRRSSFSSVASDLLPPEQQPQGLLLQGPLGFEVPVGAAVDPAVASPFRLQQQQQQQLLPSEPSSVESSATKRTAASAVGTPGGGWAPQALLQQDIDIGDWNLPEEEGAMLQQGAADVGAAGTAAAAKEQQHLGIAAAEALRLAQSSSPRKRTHQKQLRLQLDEALCRSQLTPAAAPPGAAAAAGAALRLLEDGTEDAEALRKSFRCYWGILKRQMGIRAFLEQQQLLQQRMPRKDFSATGAAAAAAAHAEAAPLAPLLAGGVSPLSLPSAAQAAAAALCSVCLGGACVRVAPGEAQQHHAAAVAAESAAPFIRTEAAAHIRGEGGFWGAAAAAGRAQSVAAEAAAVAAAAATRRRSSWLSRENLLKGFDSPLPPADASDDAEEAERWGESHWEQGPEGYSDHHQQQQHRQQQQQQQQQRPQQQPPVDGFREESPHFTPDGPPGASRGPRGVYRRKNGVTITLWPSAASLFELVERQQAAPGSWVFGEPPPPGAPGTPGASGAPYPVSLSELLSGHSKRTAARAFRDALALHAQGLFVLKQQMPETPGVPGAPGAPDVQGSSEAPSYPPLLILPEGATEDEEVLLGRVSEETAAAVAGAGAATEASGAADMDSETPSVTQQQTDEEVRRAAAAIAEAAKAAAAAAAERGEALISEEQLDDAVRFLVTGLIDRLQTQPRLHAHELIQWFVDEALPSSALFGVAPSAAWEVNAVYAICTLIHEGVFLASAAAHDAAPVQLATAGWGHEGLGDRLNCPFWLNGVAVAD